MARQGKALDNSQLRNPSTANHRITLLKLTEDDDDDDDGKETHLYDRYI